MAMKTSARTARLARATRACSVSLVTYVIRQDRNRGPPQSNFTEQTEVLGFGSVATRYAQAQICQDKYLTCVGRCPPRIR